MLELIIVLLHGSKEHEGDAPAYQCLIAMEFDELRDEVQQVHLVLYVPKDSDVELLE